MGWFVLILGTFLVLGSGYEEVMFLRVLIEPLKIEK